MFLRECIDVTLKTHLRTHARIYLALSLFVLLPRDHARVPDLSTACNLVLPVRNGGRCHSLNQSLVFLRVGLRVWLEFAHFYSIARVDDVAFVVEGLIVDSILIELFAVSIIILVRPTSMWGDSPGIWIQGPASPWVWSDLDPVDHAFALVLSDRLQMNLVGKESVTTSSGRTVAVNLRGYPFGVAPGALWETAGRLVYLVGVKDSLHHVALGLDSWLYLLELGLLEGLGAITSEDLLGRDNGSWVVIGVFIDDHLLEVFLVGENTAIIGLNSDVVLHLGYKSDNIWLILAESNLRCDRELF